MDFKRFKPKRLYERFMENPILLGFLTLNDTHMDRLKNDTCVDRSKAK